MKKLAILLLSLASFVSYGQGVTTNWFFGDVTLYNSSDFYEVADLGTYSYTEEEKRNILEKQYLSKEYMPVRIDKYPKGAYLRYNLYNDQMEFSKDGVIYYLKKEEGRTVRFTKNNTRYKVYTLNEQLSFMKVEAEGEYSLLVKESKKFVPPKKRRTTYGHHIKATFKRNKDISYLKLSNGKLVQVPSKKVAFFDLFGKEAKTLKAYMKKNKIGFKKTEDLKKVVQYLNSWSNQVQKG